MQHKPCPSFPLITNLSTGKRESLQEGKKMKELGVRSSELGGKEFGVRSSELGGKEKRRKGVKIT